MLGPQMSVSMMPTILFGSEAKACASIVVNVDFPTPPFPLRTRILCFIPLRREAIRGISGSGPLGAVAQMVWFGQLAQASL